MGQGLGVVQLGPLWLKVSPTSIKVLISAASALGSSQKDLFLSSLVQLLMGGSFCACWVEGLSSSLTVGQRLPQFLATWAPP